MTDRKIHIYTTNSTIPENVELQSYYDVLKLIKSGAVEVHTLDVTSFCMDVLIMDCYDIVIHRDFGNGHEVLVASEIAKNLVYPCGFEYTRREIRKSHNIMKMFRAGAFSWKPVALEYHSKVNERDKL